MPGTGRLDPGLARLAGSIAGGHPGDGESIGKVKPLASRVIAKGPEAATPA